MARPPCFCSKIKSLGNSIMILKIITNKADKTNRNPPDNPPQKTIMTDRLRRPIIQHLTTTTTITYVGRHLLFIY